MNTNGFLIQSYTEVRTQPFYTLLQTAGRLFQVWEKKGGLAQKKCLKGNAKGTRAVGVFFF